MIKPTKVLCKRSLIIGNDYYFDEMTGEKIPYDNRMLVKGDWYDVVYNQYDTDETFSIIDNQGCVHLHIIYGEENDNNYKLPRTYAKWFYTPKELEKKLKRQEEK
jgi:hypothetical protein